MRQLVYTYTKPMFADNAGYKKYQAARGCVYDWEIWRVNNGSWVLPNNKPAEHTTTRESYTDSDGDLNYRYVYCWPVTGANAVSYNPVSVGINDPRLFKVDAVFSETWISTPSRYSTFYIYPNTNVNVTYKVYVNSENANYTKLGFIDTYEIWIDAYSAVDSEGIVYSWETRKIYESADLDQLKLYWIEWSLINNTWQTSSSDFPTGILTDPFIFSTPTVNHYRNSHATFSTEQSPVGTHLWFQLTAPANLPAYQSVQFSLTINDEAMTLTDNKCGITLQEEATYEYIVTADYYYHNVSVYQYVIQESFTTLTALMYFDPDGNIGIGAKPEAGSITCNAFNLYEPGYKDCEYCLFSIRSRPDGTGNDDTHTLLFEPTTPVVENGSQVTITGKFTFIQWLKHQPPLGLNRIKHPPTITCTAVDGSGVLWSLPNTLPWTYKAAPMGKEALYGYKSTSNYSVHYSTNIIRSVWEVTTSITFDTNQQLEKEFYYSATYWDLSDLNYYLTNVTFIPEVKHKVGSTYVVDTPIHYTYTENNLKFTTVSELCDYDCNVYNYMPNNGVFTRDHTGMASSKYKYADRASSWTPGTVSDIGTVSYTV